MDYPVLIKREITQRKEFIKKLENRIETHKNKLFELEEKAKKSKFKNFILQ